MNATITEAKTMQDNPQPGQALLCRTCCHWSARAWLQGHPSPCSRVRWVGTKHKAPTLADGECTDYEPVKHTADVTASSVLVSEADTFDMETTPTEGKGGPKSGGKLDANRVPGLLLFLSPPFTRG